MNDEKTLEVTIKVKDAKSVENCQRKRVKKLPNLFAVYRKQQKNTGKMPHIVLGLSIWTKAMKCENHKTKDVAKDKT